MADMKNKLKFNPLFSYNVYRDEELIFGYKELDISIYFQAATLCPYVQISYTDKEDNADNIYEMLDKIFLRGTHLYIHFIFLIDFYSKFIKKLFPVFYK